MSSGWHTHTHTHTNILLYAHSGWTVGHECAIRAKLFRENLRVLDNPPLYPSPLSLSLLTHRRRFGSEPGNIVTEKKNLYLLTTHLPSQTILSYKILFKILLVPRGHHEYLLLSIHDSILLCHFSGLEIRNVAPE